MLQCFLQKVFFKNFLRDAQTMLPCIQKYVFREVCLEFFFWSLNIFFIVIKKMYNFYFKMYILYWENVDMCQKRKPTKTGKE